MNKKNEKFKIALDYLCENYGIDGQKGLSEATGITETTISRILNDKVKKPSDETLRKLNSAFNGIFNLEFFRGIDENMLVVESSNNAPTTSHPTPISDTHSIIADLQDELILVRQLRHELLALTSELRHIIHNHPSQPYPSIAAEDTPPPPTYPPDTPDTPPHTPDTSPHTPDE